MNAKSCLAMLLAGGEGRRLGPLTAKLAKPAVPFGGHSRIIDYTLSNCVHSRIETIGVLTQYQADSLHKHIGDGRTWSAKKTAKRTEIALLPSSRVSERGYAGTADAIYQNLDYIDRQNPEHVLILSGDHIYKMDYGTLLEEHRASGASATIAVKRVPWKEASRFGIMNTDETGRIVDFAEKPAEPQSNLASMGIYMFRWSDLRSMLLKDAANEASSHDFGKDLIPDMLKGGIHLQAHSYEGYWRDVGTIDSLWEAHMDLIDDQIQALGTYDPEAWPILSKEKLYKPSIPAIADIEVHNSIIHPGSSIEGDVGRSVVFGDVTIGQNSDVRESVIMPGARIGCNVWLYRAIIGEGAVIEDGAVIGSMNGEVTVIVADERVSVHPRFEVTPSRLPHNFYEDSEAYSPFHSHDNKVLSDNA
ncbi:glucose-1-phosphate adenylyltransferase [Paenibacillus nasutitermitis]|uniref:Glucose-1-phosphate adenylyltransferase n=1 Tax=Paenibacillus nasutitermitis TaxID=1652958 RepID=A0A916ZF35_9BACL|nr:glucose-1-phosphate adenylyltransferase [Paenibacillus nasutitermitis]GGD93275.1 glucose-1-phosphate adenylyltransferase [Paenibacillus nasutitermitis]